MFIILQGECADILLTGPLSGFLTNIYGFRWVAMVGGLLGSLGLVLSSFANNIYHLYCTFGMLTGKVFVYFQNICLVVKYSN